MKELIEKNLEDPAELEKIFRQAPEVFQASFDEVFQAHPGSLLLGAWYERLRYQQPVLARSEKSFLYQPSEILLIILIGLVGGTLAKLPFWTSITEEFFYPRNLAFIVLPGIAFYFLIRNAVQRGLMIGISLVFLGVAIFMNALPDLPASDTIILACIHVPFFLWALTGFAFAGNRYRELEPRMQYLKFNGEMSIYAVLIMIGGVLLTMLTMGLFSVIGLEIEEWYMQNIALYGAAAVPIVATYITINRGHLGQRIAPTIAKIFSPLVLLTLMAFLIANVVQGKSPFTDRDFLIIFNAMLMGVLAITVFTISERPSSDTRIVSDYIALALVSVALVVDVIALSAIVFRLSSYGITPNRLAVLGANLLVFGHLAGIVYHYVEFLRGKVDMEDVERWVTRYLPVYTAWTAFVVFAMPFLFKFA